MSLLLPLLTSFPSRSVLFTPAVILCNIHIHRIEKRRLDRVVFFFIYTKREHFFKRERGLSMNEINQSRCLVHALQSFGDRVSSCRAENRVLPWGPMLPYVFPRYTTSRKRMFYIGRDTLAWDLGEASETAGFSSFFTQYDNGTLEEYLKRNASMLGGEMRIEGWKNARYSFWHVVNLLHLYEKFRRVCDLSHLTDEERQALDEMGYGNLNAIELPATCQKQGYWGNLDKEKYHCIQCASQESLNKFSLIMEAFHPDVATILTWSSNEASYFDGLAYDLIEENDFGKWRVNVYKVESKDCSTIVLWTYHPAYFPRISLDVETFLCEMGKILKRHSDVY